MARLPAMMINSVCVAKICFLAALIVSTAVGISTDLSEGGVPRGPTDVLRSVSQPRASVWPSRPTKAYSGPLTSLPLESQKLWQAVCAHNDSLVVDLLNTEKISPDFGTQGISLLHRAIMDLNEKTVEEVISRCQDVDVVDSDGNTPLHWAIANEKASAKALLNAGANVDAMGALGTPLTLGIHVGVDAEFLQLLLDHHADITKCDKDGFNPIHVAAAQMTPIAFDVLRRAGASIHHLDPRGCTALHHAVGSGCVSVINGLLNAGADINSRCAGQSALHIALLHSRIGIYELLRARGADEGAVNGSGVSASALFAASWKDGFAYDSNGLSTAYAAPAA